MTEKGHKMEVKLEVEERVHKIQGGRKTQVWDKGTGGDRCENSGGKMRQIARH